MAKAKTVTAFQYDNSRTGADHPVEFGVVPGTWTPEVPVLAEAFGMTDEQLRATIREYDLPIVEVDVAERDAVAVLDRGPNRFETEQDAARVQPTPDDRVRHTKNGPIPAGPVAVRQGKLQPITAAMMARDTVRSQGGSMEDAAQAARDAGGAAGEEIARLAELGAEREHELAETAEDDLQQQEQHTDADSADEHAAEADAGAAAGTDTVEA